MNLFSLKKLLVILLAAILSACAFPTTEAYEEMLHTWIGKSEKDLISDWGLPDSVYQVDDIKYVKYENSSSGYIPGTPPSYTTTFIGNTTYTTPIGGSPGFHYTTSCETTFTIQDGIIKNWQWKGNACKAYPKD